MLSSTEEKLNKLSERKEEIKFIWHLKITKSGFPGTVSSS